jgi:hypothetical protein
MKKLLITAIILLCASFAWFLYIVPLSRGGTPPPVEPRIIGRISSEAMLFARRSSGVWPTNWLQLTNLIQDNLYFLAKKRTLIPEAYAFVPTNLPLTGHYGGDLIIIRRTSIKKDGQRGRYFVCHTPDDEFRDGWISEQEVQALFSKFGVTLPPPNPEEVRAAREAVEKALAEDNAVREVIDANAPRPTPKQRWLLIKDRVKRLFLARADEGAGDPFVTQEVGLVRIRPVPVTLAALLLVAIGFLSGRRFAKRKPPSGSAV